MSEQEVRDANARQAVVDAIGRAEHVADRANKFFREVRETVEQHGERLDQLEAELRSLVEALSSPLKKDAK